MWEETIGGMQNKTRQNRTKLQHKLQIRRKGNDQPGDLGEPPENASSQTSLFYLKSRFCSGLIVLVLFLSLSSLFFGWFHIPEFAISSGGCLLCANMGYCLGHEQEIWSSKAVIGPSA